MANLEIRKLLVLSTAHVTAATASMLNTLPVMRWPVCGGPYADNGWFMYAHEENMGEGEGHIPEDLFTILQFARTRGCDNVLIDRDGPKVEDLPVYDGDNGELLYDGWTNGDSRAAIAEGWCIMERSGDGTLEIQCDDDTEVRHAFEDDDAAVAHVEAQAAAGSALHVKAMACIQADIGADLEERAEVAARAAGWTRTDNAPAFSNFQLGRVNNVETDWVGLCGAEGIDIGKVA